MKNTKTKRKKCKASKELPHSRVRLTFKRHFVPPLGGLVAFLLVFGFFNSEPLSARIAYSFYSKRNAEVRPETRPVTQPPVPVKDKNAPSFVSIDNIGVNAPVIYSQKVVDEDAFQVALRSGVVHYPGTALPGETGNVVIFGHSSSPWWAKGDYKYVFTLLDKLGLDDLISVDYEGIRYTYRVNNTMVVEPTDTSVLNQNDSKTLTLITCSPVGSNTKRLIVQAVQIEPAIKSNLDSVAPVVLPDTVQENDLPGASSGFWTNFLNLF